MTSPIKPTDRARVEDLLERYGADPERFPAAERDTARQLLRDDPSLAARAEDAAALDALLGASTAGEPSADLMRRVAEIPLHHPKAIRSTSFGAEPGTPFHFFRAAFAGLFAAALGVIVGLQSLPASEGQDGTVAVADDASESDELLTLAFADDFMLDDSLDLESSP